ncbi:hypothetical protein [Chlorobaculum sp. 24CR]|uniref:hypothetical protein n=1 Tax=Chlorobaculum sp. 24CR TaxID=2508878 RepID=UPI00143147D1|nr:hypothetical protein [Chlorobaculum sp. 24CR]
MFLVAIKWRCGIAKSRRSAIAAGKCPLSVFSKRLSLAVSISIQGEAFKKVFGTVLLSGADAFEASRSSWHNALGLTLPASSLLAFGSGLWGGGEV